MSYGPRRGLEAHGILVRPVNDARLGPGFMRITTALPPGSARFVEVLRGRL